MIILTSIAPEHGNQKEAVKSWRQYGDIYSFNSRKEINKISDLYPDVLFIETDRVDEKNRVYINAILDSAKYLSDDVFMIINSDIIIDTEVMEKYIALSEKGIVVAQRKDFDTDKREAKNFIWGYDAFIIHKNFINIFTQSLYVMGKTHWDYWIPLIAINNKVDIIKVTEPFIFHKNHERKAMADFGDMSLFMRWEQKLFDFPETTEGRDSMNTFLLRKIMSNLIEV